MLAAGFGAEVPEVSADRWFKIGNMILSALFSAIFIGNISSFMIGLDSSGRMFNEKIEEVNQYISYKGFNADIKRRILSYYQLKYSQGKFFDENKILSELNQPLRQFISLQECQSLILKVPFFKDADRFFISQVVMILRINHFLPGDFVIEEGTTGDQMFFISSGTLEVIVGGAPRAKLSPGLFFGGWSLVHCNQSIPSAPRIPSRRTSSHAWHTHECNLTLQTIRQRLHCCMAACDAQHPSAPPPTAFCTRCRGRTSTRSSRATLSWPTRCARSLKSGWPTTPSSKSRRRRSRRR
ncbi:cyclic nucleotide-binding-like protein [Entophlyctis helioformis]|nr:cyclic nucleotide-binding-like protein [Entophlyctis helioformis]